MHDSLNRGYIKSLKELLKADSTVIDAAKNLATAERLRADSAWGAKLLADKQIAMFKKAERWSKAVKWTGWFVAAAVAVWGVVK